jgi:hypothetical protein
MSQQTGPETAGRETAGPQIAAGGKALTGDRPAAGRRRWDETVRRARVLAEEATLLGADGGAPGVAWLGAAATWLGEVAPTWAAMAGSVPTTRAYRRLLAAPGLEAWLICWPRDGSLELHDHGGASGAFCLLEGVLEEESLTTDGSGDTRVVAGAPHRRTVWAGQTVAFEGNYIHDVRNTSGPVATSVHVYGAAERAMAFYRRDGRLVRRVALGDDRSLVSAEIAGERMAGVHPAGGGRRRRRRDGQTRRA